MPVTVCHRQRIDLASDFLFQEFDLIGGPIFNKWSFNETKGEHGSEVWTLHNFVIRVKSFVHSKLSFECFCLSVISIKEIWWFSSESACLCICCRLRHWCGWLYSWTYDWWWCWDRESFLDCVFDELLKGGFVWSVGILWFSFLYVEYVFKLCF